MHVQYITKDTGETITAPTLPADDRWGDGYDWMGTLHGTSWSEMGAWGTDGWDAGSWPYIIFAVATTRDLTTHEDETGPLYGYGTYIEGDTTTRWYRNQDAYNKAITAEVFWYWKMGQADGPKNLPETADELAAEYTTPF